MDVYLNYDEHKLEVQQRIDYTNVTSETLPNLMLNVHPNRSRGTFKLNDVRVDVDGELVTARGLSPGRDAARGTAPSADGPASTWRSFSTLP